MIGVFLSIVYSAPPVIMKSQPILELFVNSSLFMVLFIVGVFLGGGTLTDSTLMFSIFVLILIIPFQLIQELKDLEQDRSNDLTTTGVYTSISGIKAMMISSIVASMLLSMVIPMPYQRLKGFSFLTVLLCVFLSFFTITLRADDPTQYKRYRVLMRLTAIVYGTFLFLLFIITPEKYCT